MRALICGALAAMTLGGIGGAGMRLAPDEFSTRPNGPQLVMTPPRTYSFWEHDPAPIDASYPGGVMPDYVLGTDWVYGRAPPAVAPVVMARTAAYSDAAALQDAAPTPIKPVAEYRATLPYYEARLYAYLSGGKAEPAPQAPAQLIQYGVVHDQGGRQVDDVAHRPDPSPLGGEALAQRAALNRVGELDHPDGPLDPYVPDPG
jgi:hypothetical protein